MRKLIDLNDLLDKIENKLGNVFHSIYDDYDTGYANGVSAVISIIHNMPVTKVEDNATY